jgi:hypothetical protein
MMIVQHEATLTYPKVIEMRERLVGVKISLWVERHAYETGGELAGMILFWAVVQN